MKLWTPYVLILCVVNVLVGAVSCNTSSRHPADAIRTPSAPAAASTPAPVAHVAPSKDVVTSARLKGGAEILGVGLAADGIFIAIRYIVPPPSVRGLRQGTVYVIDEATRRAYREVPVMPALGPVLSHPRRAGQIGYAMLVNAPVRLKSGSIVTVVLGDYKQEHMLIQ